MAPTSDHHWRALDRSAWRGDGSLMRIGIIGVTGLIGKALAAELASRDHEVVGYSRSPEAAVQHVGEMRQINDGVADFSHLDALVNLAGFPVNCRWNDENRRKIRDSRIALTESVVRQLAAIEPAQRPRRFVVGTAVGIYGERGDEELPETAAPGIDDFLGEVVEEWERAAFDAAVIDMSVTCVRTGIVLGKDSEAFSQMRKVFALGLGGKLGSGEQWMPWVHLKDLAKLFAWALENADAPPILNGTAPSPERNVVFTRKLAKALNRPAFFAVPGFALELALGPFGKWLLKSSKVIPSASREAGFKFDFPDLDSALADLVSD